MVRKRSCPAVSQICSLIDLLSRKIFLILKSILCGPYDHPHQHHISVIQQLPIDHVVNAHPMVVMKLDWKESSEKRNKMQLLPTPETCNGESVRKGC